MERNKNQNISTKSKTRIAFSSLNLLASPLYVTVSRRGEKTSPRSLLEPSSRERREFSLNIGVNQGLDRESIARGFAGVQRSASP